jgi:hypothetical protein
MKLTTLDLPLVLPLFLAWSPALAQGKVWVVDDFGGPGVDFTALQPAVDAAAEGDTIRILPGTYSGAVVIDGKGLSMVGSVTPEAKLSGSLQVKNLAPHQGVLLHGLTVKSSSSSDYALLLLANAGTVWVQQCAMQGEDRIDGCAKVILVRSSFSGASPSLLSGDPGLVAYDSSTHAHDCDFIGGDGTYGGWKFGATFGGRGFWLKGGFLFASGCTFVGGDAGLDPDCGSITGAGDGLLLEQGPTAPTAKTVGCTFQEGAEDPVCGTWFPALPINVWAGEHEALSGTPCTLSANGFLSEGGILTATFLGTPNATAFLALSLEPDALFLEPFLGSLHLAPPYAILLSAQLSPLGSLTLDLPVGFLPPGVDSEVFFAQLGLLLPGGTFQLCSGSALTLLDEQF